MAVVAAHKRRINVGQNPEDVPVEQVEHRLEGQELVCPQCGGELTEIGKEVINKLKIIPARVVVEQHIYCSYACQRCNKENITTPVVCAPRENRFLPGSFAAPEAVAHIMTQKFVMGIPIYLKGGRLEISNNRAERSIKPFVIDRKIFLFANTPKRCCRKRGYVQSYTHRYGIWVGSLRVSFSPLRMAARMDLTKTKNVAALLPENAPLECRISTPE